MRALVPLLMLLSVAGFHSALSASLEAAEKKEEVVHYDGLLELQKIDQMEFEAAQKEGAAQMNGQKEFEAAQKEQAVHVNVTDGHSEDTRYLDAAKDGCVGERREPADVDTERDGTPEAAAWDESESSEEMDARHRREHNEAVTEAVSSSEEVIQDTTSKQDGLE